MSKPVERPPVDTSIASEVAIEAHALLRAGKARVVTRDDHKLAAVCVRGVGWVRIRFDRVASTDRRAHSTTHEFPWVDRIFPSLEEALAL